MGSKRVETRVEPRREESRCCINILLGTKRSRAMLPRDIVNQPIIVGGDHDRTRSS